MEGTFTHESCCGCLWEDICEFYCPCNDYTPCDDSDLLAYYAAIQAENFEEYKLMIDDYSDGNDGI